jgi:hypothetical protein
MCDIESERCRHAMHQEPMLFRESDITIKMMLRSSHLGDSDSRGNTIRKQLSFQQIRSPTVGL